MKSIITFINEKLKVSKTSMGNKVEDDRYKHLLLVLFDFIEDIADEVGMREAEIFNEIEETGIFNFLDNYGYQSRYFSRLNDDIINCDDEDDFIEFLFTIDSELTDMFIDMI